MAIAPTAWPPPTPLVQNVDTPIHLDTLLPSQGPVAAVRVINYSADTVYAAYDTPAHLGTIQIPTGGGILFDDVKVSTLHLYTTQTGVSVNGTGSSAGVVVWGIAPQ